MNLCSRQRVDPRYQTPFGNAMRREIAFSTAGVSVGRSRRQAGPQTPHARETEFRPKGHSQTEFGNEGQNLCLKGRFREGGREFISRNPWRGADALVRGCPANAPFAELRRARRPPDKRGRGRPRHACARGFYPRKSLSVRSARNFRRAASPPGTSRMPQPW